MCIASISINYFNLLLFFLGIRAKLLNFAAFNNVNDTQATKIDAASQSKRIEQLEQKLNGKPLKFIKYVPILFCIAFVFSYMSAALDVMQHIKTGKKGRKTLDYFICIVFYGTKIIVTIIIYGFQYWNDQLMCAVAADTMKTFYEIEKINRYWPCGKCRRVRQFVPDKNRQHANRKSQVAVLPANTNHHNRHCRRHFNRSNLNAFNQRTIFEIVLNFVGYIVGNYIICYHRLRLSRPIGGYDFIWYNFASVFISLFVWQLSISVRQYVNLFEWMNSIAIDIRHQVAHPTKSIRRTKRIINPSIAERIMDATTSCQFYTTTECVSQLFEVHDRLRENARKLQQLNAIQTNAVVGNAFICLVSEVSAFLCCG